MSSNAEFYTDVLGMPADQAQGQDVLRPDLVPVSPEQADEILAQVDDEE